MRVMNKICLVLLSTMLLMGCSNQSSDKGSNIPEESSVIVETTVKVDEEKVAKAIELGYPSPSTEIITYVYKPLETDAITYDATKSGFDLAETLIHKGFKGLKIDYYKTQYKWSEFMDDIDATEVNRSIAVQLKGESIHESDVVDEYQSYYRYYDENEGIYYEVQDFMVGNFLEKNAELTNKKLGQSCNYAAAEGMEAPTYNPIYMYNDEESLSYYITELEGEPCLYIESLYNDRLYKKWISIHYGVVVKELAFDNEGLLRHTKVAQAIEEVTIDDSVFAAPRDIDYKDITMFVYSIDGGDLETLYRPLTLNFENETGVRLTSDEGDSVTFYTTGLGDEDIEEVIYVSEITNMNGETRNLRQLKSGKFYTICEELETIEIYERSAEEQKFFEFESLGLLAITTTDKGMNFAFYDDKKPSVSGLIDVYEYVIEDSNIVAVNCYEIEEIIHNEPVRDIRTYTIEYIDFDESVYDESCMDTYEIIDHGEGSVYDGEHMPFYYQN